ncbi:hypothetical protein TA3x_003443 [Tundrisphaera sp. TA3]|uniref:hypothetical protein n=1 Tax=Tundrisphaera sp. TA3 TaxID=3435775 RepID=UPI003EC0C45D
MTWGMAAALLAFGVSPAPDGPPRAEAPKTSAVPFFLDVPADRETFWNRLLRPDFVVVDGAEFQGLRDREAAKPPGGTRPPIILSVAAAGRVDGDWARLSIAFGIVVERDGPAWATVRLDGLTLARASVGGKDIPARVGEDRAWQVELPGRGEHLATIEVLAPVRGAADSRRLDLAIPPAASTRIDLDVPRDVLTASTAANEPMAVAHPGGSDGPASRISARLNPRAKLELVWRERANPAVLLPTLLAVQGEIALEVERGFLRTRSQWIVSAVRGSVDRISFRAGPGEEVLDVEVDDEPAVFEGRAEAGRLVVLIPLDEPLRPDRPRRLRVTARRAMASIDATRVTFQGYPFDEAKVQTGVLAISRAGPLFPVPTAGRGLRRIDARTELPERLRARPDILMAFEFTAQPFELGLQIEPEPPLVRIDSRATVTLEPQSARVDSRFDCRVTQGRPFELSFLIPEGLDLESAGPPEVVESSRVVAEGPAPPPGSPPIAGARVLTIALARAAREAETFQVSLKGRAEIDAGPPVSIPLFCPREPSSGSVVVVGSRDLAIEPGDGRPSPFQVNWGAVPPGWAWPGGAAPPPEASLLWFRHDAGARDLPLRITARPLSLRHGSATTATIDRRGADVVDDIEVAVAHGAISGLDVILPPEVPDRWEVDGVDLAGRDPIGQEPDGSRRHRLRFAREVSGGFHLRFRYRLPFAEPVAQGRDGSFRLATIRPAEGTCTGRQARLASQPGLAIEAQAPGWTAEPPEPAAPAEAGPSTRRVLERADDAHAPITVIARAEVAVPLPATIVSRAWIRTLQRSDGDLETAAWFRVESRDNAVSVALPPGSRWIRARVAGAEAVANDIEVLDADRYRIRIAPGVNPGPTLVGFEYVVPAAANVGPLLPPVILGDAVVQQTCWEVQVIGTRVGVGVPAGWTDENQWYRDGVIWKRRPWKSSAEMAAWVAGADTSPATPHDLGSGESYGRHGYLFSRAGSSAPLPFRIESRFALVAICSGPVLAIGLLVLARRPPPRSLAILGLILAFLAGTFGEVSVILLVLQSASLGLILLVAAVVMQRLIARGDVPPRPAAAARMVVSPSAASSPQGEPDESTVIRASRPADAMSTADHPASDPASITRKTPIAPSTASLGPQ